MSWPEIEEALTMLISYHIVSADQSCNVGSIVSECVCGGGGGGVGWGGGG